MSERTDSSGKKSRCEIVFGTIMFFVIGPVLALASSLRMLSHTNGRGAVIVHFLRLSHSRTMYLHGTPITHPQHVERIDSVSFCRDKVDGNFRWDCHQCWMTFCRTSQHIDWPERHRDRGLDPVSYGCCSREGRVRHPGISVRALIRIWMVINSQEVSDTQSPSWTLRISDRRPLIRCGALRG